MKKTTNVIYLVIVGFIVILGFFLRICLYKQGIPLWTDEISLALSTLKHNIWYSFFELEVNQKCPPLFMFFSYIINAILGHSVYSVRLIPLFSGLLSIFAFYILINDFYKSKISKIMALFIFVSCVPLIYYSSEFKPYSTDVLICILLIFLYKYIDFTNVDKKKKILYSISAFLLPLLSFPTLFIIPAFVTMKLIDNYNNKITKLIKSLLPITIGYFLSGLYLVLLYRKIRECELVTCDEWENSFFNFSFSHNINIINNLFSYIDLNFIIGGLFLIVGITILCVKRNKTNFLMLFILFYSAIASFFKLYPMHERMILYLIPIVIIYIFEPIDAFLSAEKNKINLIYCIKAVIIPCILSVVLLCSFKYNNFFDWKSYCLRVSYEERLYEKWLYNTFLKLYDKNEKIISQMSIHNLDYYGILNNNKYDIYDNFIAINPPILDFNKKMEEYISEIGQNESYWIIFDYSFPISEYGEQLENILNEHNIKYDFIGNKDYSGMAMYHILGEKN